MGTISKLSEAPLYIYLYVDDPPGGNHVYCAHTVTHNNANISQGWHLPNLQITFMKYGQYCLRILGVNAQSILFHIFLCKVE